MDIGYKCNSQKVLGFIATKGDGINEPGDLYLSFLPNNYSYVYFWLVVCPHVIGRYFNGCNVIDNKNRMRQ